MLLTSWHAVMLNLAKIVNPILQLDPMNIQTTLTSSEANSISKSKIYQG